VIRWRVDRTALVVALTACCAAVAFGVGATALDDASPSFSLDSPGGEVTAENNTTAGGGGGGGEPDNDSEADCPDCGALDFRSRLAGSLPGVDGGLLLGVTALVVLGLGVLGLRGEGGSVDDGGETTTETGLETGPDRGRDTVFERGDVAVTNDVYRAWQQLLERVGEREATLTPREYADRAASAGFDADAVERLADLFARVRYGDEPPTESDEQAARDALNRLEDGGED